MSLVVSLRLFYNLGRIPVICDKMGSSRVMLTKGDCDRTPLRIDRGRYVCRWCGVEILHRESRLFCSFNCRKDFETRLGTMSWAGFREIIYARDEGRCKLCGELILRKVPDRWHPTRIFETRNFVCDHIIPLCYGGRDWYEDPQGTNFQTLCVACNKVKTREDMSGPKWVHKNSKLTQFLVPGVDV